MILMNLKEEMFFVVSFIDLWIGRKSGLVVERVFVKFKGYGVMYE
jgi:hypothetical protein